MEEIQLDATVVVFISGVLIPIVTGLVTKYAAADGVKGLVSLTLAVVVGALNELVVAGGAFHLQGLLISAGGSWLISLATYYGVYASQGGIPNLPWKANLITPDFGFGKKLEEEPPPGFPEAA